MGLLGSLIGATLNQIIEEIGLFSEVFNYKVKSTGLVQCFFHNTY